MAKQIPWIYATVLALSSFSIHAAELGKITVTSGLGQPLRAEIELKATPDELASLNVRLASQEAFQQAGIQRVGSLLKVRFNVENKKKGKTILRLSTAQPVNDPFLDMLVELDWGSGRLLREYTVLLDPPGRSTHEAIAPVAAPTVAAHPVPPPPEAKPVPVAAPSEPASPETAPSTQPAAAGDSKSADEKTYAVKKGDTLSSIARELKPRDLSLDQMLVALYQANKQAFTGNNMNRLKKGQILRVPEEQQIAATGRAEAALEVKTQTADWNAYRQKLAAVVEAAPAPHEDTPKRATQGKITAAVEDQAAPAPAPSQDVLKVSKGTSNAKEAQALQNKITALQEETTAKAKAIREAGERIAALEKNVKDMEHLIELKNKDLASLESTGESDPKPAATPPRMEPPAAPPVEAQKPMEAQNPVEAAKPVAVHKIAVQANDESSNKTLYFAGGLVGLLVLGGGAAVLITRQRKKSIYTDQSLTSLYNTTS